MLSYLIPAKKKRLVHRKGGEDKENIELTWLMYFPNYWLFHLQMSEKYDTFAGKAVSC